MLLVHIIIDLLVYDNHNSYNLLQQICHSSFLVKVTVGSHKRGNAKHQI